MKTAGATGPKILFAGNTQVDPRRRCGEVPPERPHHVEGLAFGLVQDTRSEPERDGRCKRPVDQPSASDVPKARPSSTGKPTDRPLPLLGDLGELSRRVERDEVAPTTSNSGKSSWLSE